jgi:hypothetical protein
MLGFGDAAHQLAAGRMVRRLGQHGAHAGLGDVEAAFAELRLGFLQRDRVATLPRDVLETEQHAVAVGVDHVRGAQLGLRLVEPARADVRVGLRHPDPDGAGAFAQQRGPELGIAGLLADELREARDGFLGLAFLGEAVRLVEAGGGSAGRDEQRGAEGGQDSHHRVPRVSERDFWSGR